MLFEIVIPEGVMIGIIVALMAVLLTVLLIAVSRKSEPEKQEPQRKTERSAVKTLSASESEPAPAQSAISEEPKEERAPEPLPLPVTKPVQSVRTEDTATTGRVLVNGDEVLVRYNRSFLAKLIQGKEQTKEFYSELHNYIMSYERVRHSESRTASSYIAGRQKTALLTIKGKTLCMYLPLNEEECAGAKYPVKLVEAKSYAALPLEIKIRSARALKAGKCLIDAVMAKSERGLGVCKAPVSPADFPYEDTESLIARGLIRLTAVKGGKIEDGARVKVLPFSLEPITVVSAEQAHELMSDAAASSVLMPDTKRTGCAGKKFVINIDTLSECFENGATVNIDTLKAKNLIPKRASAIKILARGTLDKRLAVEAESFSLDAVKMIALLGGEAYELAVK